MERAHNGGCLVSQEPTENVLGVVDGGMEGGVRLDPLSVQVHSAQRTTVTIHTQQRVYSLLISHTYTQVSDFWTHWAIG